MKGKRILAAALSAAMLLGSGAQAASTPTESSYPEIRLMAAKDVMDNASYAALSAQMSGSDDQRAGLANSGFQNGSDHLQVQPGETFWLAMKVDASHLESPYYGVFGGNVYYEYDSSVFIPDVENGHMNHLTAGRAGITPNAENLDYCGELNFDMGNSKLSADDTTFFSFVFNPRTYRYYIPAKATWDYAFPVKVSESAYAGTYTIRYENGTINNIWGCSLQLGVYPNGQDVLLDFHSANETEIAANDVTIEVVNAPQRPVAPEKQQEPDHEPVKGFYVNGRPDGSFGAVDGIRRDEFVKMLTVAAKLYRENHNYPNWFADVPAGNWAARYIGCAVENGLVTGLPDGTFGAARTITRGEAAAILARVLKLEKSDSRPFSDLEGDWAAGYVAALADGGYVNGYSDGTFRSSDVLHRVEAVKMINSALGVSFTPEETAQAKTIPSPFTDVAPNYWAYADILYAAGLIEK